MSSVPSLFFHLSVQQRNLCPRICTGASVQLCRAIRSSLQKSWLDLPGKQSSFYCKNICIGQRHCMNTANIFTVKISLHEFSSLTLSFHVHSWHTSPLQFSWCVMFHLWLYSDNFCLSFLTPCYGSLISIYLLFVQK